jgi:hypothetical protein
MMMTTRCLISHGGRVHTTGNPEDAECFPSDTRQRHSLPSVFAECREENTQYKKTLGKERALLECFL